MRNFRVYLIIIIALGFQNLSCTKEDISEIPVTVKNVAADTGDEVIDDEPKPNI